MKKRSLVIGLGAVAVVAIVAAVLLSSGSGNSPDTTVRGFLADTAAGNYAGMCSKLVPSVQPGCASKLQIVSSTLPNNLSFNVSTTSVIQGNRALVYIVGRACSGSSCKFVGNPYDATQGISVGFNAAFSSAFSSISLGTYNQSDPVVPCLLVNGHWYIDIPATALDQIPT